MAKYEVEVSGRAEKQLKALQAQDQARVVKAILRLAENPRPRGFRKLTGYEDVFRIRVGRFRILYSLEGARLVIIILKVGHRRDVYR